MKDLGLSSEFALRRNGQLFALRSQPRVFLCQSSPCQRHCRSTLRCGSPRQTTRCSRSCQSSHVSCALGCSCVELLDRFTLIRHLLGRWRRLHDLLLQYLDSLLFQLVGRHALGTLLQHLVVCCLVWSSPLHYHVCRKTCLLSCLSDACHGVSLRPFEALFGPPTAFRRNGPSVPWVSLPGPTGVMTHPK